ncbi:MAG: hypothetical protein IT440_13545, partial [Phycisphaeraceae bacterium]|nr:hypothetical protein [Phycisphaeraceae bacterium]
MTVGSASCITMARKVCLGLALLLAAIPTLPGAALAAEDAIENQALKLEFPKSDNEADRDGGCLLLRGAYVQPADQPLIVVEAERATTTRMVSEKGKVVADPLAGGGYCLEEVRTLAFSLKVAKAGKYVAWYRGWFPHAGGWIHSDQMDDGEMITNADSQGDKLNTWVWCRGPVYELTEGPHVWSLSPFAWCGGARLDKLVLAPESWTPPEEGMGPESLTQTGPHTGNGYTEPLLPHRIVRWKQLTWKSLVETGKTNAFWSGDESKTWNPIGPDGDLSALPVDKPVTFRVQLVPDDKIHGPIVKDFVATYERPRLEPISLQNQAVKLAFSAYDGQLVDLVNLRGGQSYMEPNVDNPWFAFKTVRGEYGGVEDLKFTQSKFLGAQTLASEHGPALALRYSLLKDAISVVIHVLPEPDGVVRLRMTIDNKSDLNIAQVIFPKLHGLRIGDNEKDDYLCTPACTGSIVQYPASFLVPRQAYNYTWLVYPGNGSMCWMDLWDASGGLYLAYEDQQYRLTELLFAPGRNMVESKQQSVALPPPDGSDYKMAPQPGTSIQLGFNKRMLIAAGGGPVTMPDVVLAVHDGDWHWGADRYRAWADSWMVKTPVPDWLHDSDGVTNMHTGIAAFNFVDLARRTPYPARQIRLSDPPFPFMPTWSQQVSMEGYWSTPVLHRDMGTEDHFRWMIQTHHEMGHRMAFYVLPNHINPMFRQGVPRFANVPAQKIPADEVPPAGFYEQVGCRGYDGKLFRGPDTDTEAATDLLNPAWRNYLTHIVYDKYYCDYGADGSYLDAAGLAAFDQGNRQQYGLWNQGFCSWMEQTKIKLHEKRPGGVFMGEGMSDVEMRYLDLALYYTDNAPQVYRYTFPDNIGAMGGPPSKHITASTGFPADTGYFEMAAVYGAKFYGFDANYEHHADVFQRVKAFRERFSQFQSRARFVDNVGLKVADDKLLAKLFVRDEPGVAGALMVAYNANENPAETQIVIDKDRVNGAVTSAWSLTDVGDWTPLKTTVTPAGYAFAAPAGRMVAALLLARA